MISWSTGCLTEEDLLDSCAPDEIPEFRSLLANDALGDSPISRDETGRCPEPASSFESAPQTYVDGNRETPGTVDRGAVVTYSFPIPGDGACRDPALSTDYAIPVEGRGTITSESDDHFFIPPADSERFALIEIETNEGCSGDYGFQLGSERYSVSTR